MAGRGPDAVDKLVGRNIRVLRLAKGPRRRTCADNTDVVGSAGHHPSSAAAVMSSTDDGSPRTLARALETKWPTAPTHFTYVFHSRRQCIEPHH
jgi:hypothetical protein